jgi:hypothetical protein
MDGGLRGNDREETDRSDRDRRGSHLDGSEYGMMRYDANGARFGSAAIRVGVTPLDEGNQ